jgi:hypothetical protein
VRRCEVIGKEGFVNKEHKKILRHEWENEA